MDISKCTFAMVKPHIIKEKKLGAILSKIENSGFEITMMSMEALSREEVEVFYDAHIDKPFFNELCEIMSSGRVVALCLKKENTKDVVEDFRKLLGATNPKDAVAGTIRADFGIDINYNAVHGSDSSKTAEEELNFFFNDAIHGYDTCCGSDCNDDENCCDNF